jgi:cytochrome b6-f complex iron-sulfur subunit
MNLPENIVEEPGDKNTRRAFLAAAGLAGLAYTAALAYPIYRYLASPAEMAMEATAVSEVTLKDAQKLPAGSVLMFKFGSSPAMLIHHLDNTWVAMTAVCTHLGCTVQSAPATAASTTHTPAPTSAARRPSRSSSSRLP